MEPDGPRIGRTHHVIRRTGLIAAGYSDAEVRAAVRAGRLERVRRGAYVGAGRLPRHPRARHALAVRAAVPDLGPDVVISHVSAAILHGATVWGVPLGRIHGTRARRSGARRGSVLHLHAAAMEADEITAVDGIAVTTAARTLVDLARSVPFEQAVVLLDAALHAGTITPDSLAEALARAQRRPGAAAARRAFAFADGRSESVGESRSRVAIDRAGLPAPTLQWHVLGPDGRPIARTDFGWEEFGTVGEFDGLSKYGRELNPGRDPVEALAAEKTREDLVRAEDLAVVRWIWPDIAPFDAVAQRLRRAFTRRRGR